VISKNIYVFTDIDLDGMASLLALHWAIGAKPGDIPFKCTTVSNFRKDFLKWAETDSINNYDTVYFLDLDTSTSADLVDHKRCTIIDHHLTHVNTKKAYTNAFTHIVETTSCAKLIYQYYKPSITSDQKYFLALADDYDSYKLKLPESYDLNCLFTNTHKTQEKTRTHKFIERFYDGFQSFNTYENNIIIEYKNKRDEVIKQLQIFTGKVSINKQPVVVSGTMGNRFVNDVCDHLIEKYNSDIVFFININNQHVSWRKRKQCNVDLSKLAAKLCEGGGHEYSAGGKLTDTFMEFTKQLNTILPSE
jgi:oligoribonuclease NrnB/cAMP/cGMP phosphodiesterase (DHH superfamily)